MTLADYTATCCDKNASKAATNGDNDAGIGLDSVQMTELEKWLTTQRHSKDDI